MYFSRIESTLKTKCGTNHNCFKRFKLDGKHLICCELCMKYPATIKLHTRNQRIPKICTETRTAYRMDVVEKHLEADYHIECEKVERISLLKKPDESAMPMDFAISKANSKQANYIGKLMIQVYTDAKILTLAAWNWPARFVTKEAANAYDFQQNALNVIPRDLSLQYITPNEHLELMHSIVNSDRDNLKTKIEKYLALFVQMDGSVGRTHIDKIYVLGKIITQTGKAELIYLGVDEQVEKGAEGLFNTFLNAMNTMFTKEFVLFHIFPKLSSICTDGVNTNRGESGGVWYYLQKEVEKTKSEIPLMKI